MGLGRGKAEDTDKVGEDLPGTLLSPWVRGGCDGRDGVSGDDGGKKNCEGFRWGAEYTKFFRGRGLVEEGVETPADNLGDGRRSLRMPERERRVIVMGG